MFSCEFCEISKNTFFAENLWTTTSEKSLEFFLNFSKKVTSYAIQNLDSSNGYVFLHHLDRI